MAVPRVYVRRGTTVWSVTSHISHQTHIRLTHTGRTNIDFFIPLHNRPLKGQLIKHEHCSEIEWFVKVRNVTISPFRHVSVIQTG